MSTLFPLLGKTAQSVVDRKKEEEKKKKLSPVFKVPQSKPEPKKQSVVEKFLPPVQPDIEAIQKPREQTARSMAFPVTTITAKETVQKQIKRQEEETQRPKSLFSSLVSMGYDNRSENLNSSLRFIWNTGKAAEVARQEGRALDPEVRKEAQRLSLDSVLSADTAILPIAGTVKKVGGKVAKFAADKADDVVEGAQGLFSSLTNKSRSKALSESKTLEKSAQLSNRDSVANTLSEALPEIQNMVNKGKATIDEWTELGDIMQRVEKGKDTPEDITNAAEMLKLKGFDPFDATKRPPKDTLVTQSGELFEPEKYVKENIKRRESARKAERPGLTDRIKGTYDYLKRSFIDSNAPIEDTLASAIKKTGEDLPLSRNISDQIDRVYRAPTLAGQFVRDNGFDKLIKSVDNLDNLDEFATARHAIELDKKGFKTGRDIEKDKLLVESLGDQYEPYAQALTDYSRKLLDYSVESGQISEDLATKLKELYPTYVPMNRIFDEMEQLSASAKQTRGVASISTQSLVQRLKGSDRAIESPIASLLDNTTKAFMEGERNKAAQILTSYVDLPGNPFGLEKFTGKQKVPKGAELISVRRNGKLEKWIADKEIAEAAKRLTVKQMGTMEKVIQVPIRVAKAGITGLSLPFVGANFVADQITALITSKNSLRSSVANPAVFLDSLFQVLKKGDTYQEMVRNAGAGTSFDLLREAPSLSVKDIASRKNPASRVKYLVTNPSELLRSVENIIGKGEELTRMQQYIGTKKSLGKSSMPEEEVQQLAARAARRNTTDFFRKGDFGNVLNSAFLYMNASIQGSRTWVRRLAENPAETSAKLATTLLFPTAILTAWNLSSPEKRKVHEDIADYEKEGNLILIPNNPTKDENGKWNVIKVKAPPGMNKLAIPVRRAIEQLYGMDKVQFTEVLNSLLTSPLPFDITEVEEGKVSLDEGSILSAATPQAIKPSIEAYANKNFFTGFPIVPESMKGLSPELQVKENTSGLARKIGGALDVSPIKVEEFVRATGGSVGQQVLNAVDRVLAGLDIIPKNQVGGRKVSEGIVDRFTKARGGEANQKDVKELKKIIQKQDDENFLRKQEAELLHKELKQMSPEEANVKVKEIKNTNKILYNKLKDVVEEEKLGLDYDDRLMKQLQVQNGERAKFIFAKLEQFEDSEAKNEYATELVTKKILTPEVKKQVRQLIKEKYNVNEGR